MPVVASNLPGMAEIVRAIDAGVLCNPTDPASIARAIREVLDVTPEARAARRVRILEAARDRYNWEAETPTLLAIYAELLSTGVGRATGGSVATVGSPAAAGLARSSTDR